MSNKPLFFNLYCFHCFSFIHIYDKTGPLLFFLASHLFRNEDTYGEVPALCAVLVLHQDAVLASV